MANAIHGRWLESLAIAGRIEVEVYAKNFRVVKILVGEHAGKQTMAAPKSYGLPYKIAGKNGYRMRLTVEERIAKRQQPSAPQLLRKAS